MARRWQTHGVFSLLGYARAGIVLAVILATPIVGWGQSPATSSTTARAEAVRLRLAALMEVEPEANKPAMESAPAAPQAVVEQASAEETLANPMRAPENPPAPPRKLLAPTPAPRPTPATPPPGGPTPPPDVAPPIPETDDEHTAPPPATACSQGPRCGFHCANPESAGKLGFHGAYQIPWEVFAQGEYIGPHRTPHVPEYRLRVDDLLDFVYIFSFKATPQPYRLHVRDRLLVSSLTSPQTVDQELFVQPDGTISVRMIGQVRAVGLTIDELRGNLEQAYQPFVKKPSITLTPMELNSHLQELRAAVDRRYGAAGGQGSQVRVTPAGTIQLPIIGSVFVQGLTLSELKREVEERYLKVTEGVEITPILVARAPRFFYIVGEVRAPGRHEMLGPTTVLQAIAQAGSWNNGAHLKHVVVFRRDENWCLMATKLDLYGALQGNRPCPCDEVWIRDSDLIIVPKNPILVADDFIELVFTRGIYGVFPMSTTLNFTKQSTL
jgi:polysaccharide export outer membrane protein